MAQGMDGSQVDREMTRCAVYDTLAGDMVSAWASMEEAVRIRAELGGVEMGYAVEQVDEKEEALVNELF